MTAEQLLTENAALIRSLCCKYAVKRLRLFGSALRSDWNSEKSDLDFLAEFDPPRAGMNAFDQLLGFIGEMESALGRRIDVVDWNAARNPIFRRNVERQAREVYAA